MASHTLDRLLPQDLEAERAVLGSMLLDAAAINKAMALLGDDGASFNSERNQVIYAELVRMRAAGLDSSDSVVLKAHLKSAGLWERIGKFNELGACIASVPSALRVQHYAGIVRDKWLRRRLIGAAHQIADRAFNGEDTVGLFASALADMEALTQQVGAKSIPQGTEAVIERASAIEERPVAWLWQNRIELGALNLLASDPGAGKSLLTAALATAISRGLPWPDSRHDLGRPAANVIFVTSEDDPSKSTVPRLRVAGADLARIAIVRSVEEHGQQRQLSLQRDLATIEQTITAVGDVALVVIDPVDSYLGRADSNTNEEMRAILEPLVGIAERRNVAFLAVKHLNKSIQTPNALYRIAGTMAFVALPRTVAIIGRDPDDGDRNLLMPLKISHGPKPDALAYRVRQTDDGQPRIEWEPEPVRADPDAVLSKRSGRPPAATDRAEEWLRAALAAGPVASKELDAQAHAVGIAYGTLRHAKERLGVVAAQVREGARVTGWLVSLPSENTP